MPTLVRFTLFLCIFKKNRKENKTKNNKIKIKNIQKKSQNNRTINKILLNFSLPYDFIYIFGFIGVCVLFFSTYLMVFNYGFISNKTHLGQ